MTGKDRFDVAHHVAGFGALRCAFTAVLAALLDLSCRGGRVPVHGATVTLDRFVNGTAAHAVIAEGLRNDCELGSQHTAARLHAAIVAARARFV